ncbi:TetR/AcrR family transcriptional regulator [Acinetobacter sp. V91_7]|uniref:TetR/AcrR family transcriptional regulator n=1 Tax=Acinetobacter TaxID=469 RepID=UPI0022765142|nr:MULTISPECIES: TetR/AcrR family transcriptional regulator [Acinetobacter]MDS7927951.1 TetR/AcrR family transcriptional regulator [Acinetobacter sp. V102_4]MDS7932450.1 TetR/AcrR family transcriptional regulator [Acinetobacter sp. V91_4B]MDS7961407.1 TetR/AcrR family transcriptional regulator [Acinetobacter sp. V91_7]MDS8025931.1 TetR/AcrR family transcriptional regulator [Acinetobacter sp. V91_13]GLG83641.1 TetR family transcriptional regulator [Acinetobacter calcoaceticus]
MRYSLNHKAETRQRLIEQAGSLAKKNGFATTGVDGLMASVGLTGGAFYSHFSSKNELFKEIIQKELMDTLKRFLPEDANSSADALRQLLALYLSPTHVKHPELGCPLPILSNEVARSTDDIKQVYESNVIEIQQSLAQILKDEDTAWATLALSMGAVSLSRAMSSDKTKKQILEACKNFINRSLDHLTNEDSSNEQSQ